MLNSIKCAQSSEEVTITAFFENAGTTEIDEAVDAVLYADGIEIGRHRASNEYDRPTGSAGFESFLSNGLWTWRIPFRIGT